MSYVFSSKKNILKFHVKRKGHEILFSWCAVSCVHTVTYIKNFLKVYFMFLKYKNLVFFYLKVSMSNSFTSSHIHFVNYYLIFVSGEN